MVNKKLSKTEVKEQIHEFFSKIKNKSPKDILKIKKIAMNKRISLKEERKLFCKNCLVPYSGKEKIRIKKSKKLITCDNCGYIKRIQIELK